MGLMPVFSRSGSRNLQLSKTCTAVKPAELLCFPWPELFVEQNHQLQMSMPLLCCESFVASMMLVVQQADSATLQVHACACAKHTIAQAALCMSQDPT